MLATQRLGKLRKDAAAELLNVMIGMTFIDIDRERAGECLGISREEKHKFNDEVKLLEPGQFYCLGRAICTERTLVKVGSIQTTHPEAGGGKFSMAPPPAPEMVKAMMPKLAELPKAAEEKANTEASLRSEIRSLRGQLSARPVPVVQPMKDCKPIEIPALTGKQFKEVSWLCSKLEDFCEATKFCDEYVIRAEVIQRELRKILALPQRAPAKQLGVTHSGKLSTPALNDVPAQNRPVPPVSNGLLSAAQRKFLTVLAQRQGKQTRRNQVAIFTGYSSKSSHVDNTISSLRTSGLLEGERDNLSITQLGIDTLGNWESLPIGLDLINFWIRETGSAGGKMLKKLVWAYPNTMTRDELAEATGFSVQSSHVDNTISYLRTLELLTGGRHDLKATEEFFQ